MSEKPIMANLFAHPYIMLIVGIIGLVFLIVPVVVLWQLKMLTGVVFAIVILVIAWALSQMKLIDLEKYPLISPIIIGIAIGGFVIGFLGERTGAFLVTPLMEQEAFSSPAFLAESPTEAFLSIEVVLLLALVISVFLAWLGWSKRGR